MKKLTLKPVDTFFFKNHQVTEAGNDTVMDGIFPPRPNTIYGALRAAYIHEYATFEEFAQQGNDMVKKWMGTPNETGEFQITYCGLEYNKIFYLPLPLDYQVVEAEEKIIAYPLHLKKDTELSSQSGKWRLFSNRNEKSKSSSHQFVPIQHWKEAILNHQPIRHLSHAAQMLSGEEKLGIALNYQERKAEEHYLYRMVKWKFKEEGAFVVYTSSSPDFSSVKFARIGGENRPWIVKQNEEIFSLWTEGELQTLSEQIRKTNIAKIILLAPAIWENGSRPGSFDGEQIVLPNGLRVKLLAAAIGRPELYGGWDIANHRPKPRKPMVPAGSVLYIEVQEEQVAKLLSLANGFHLTDEGAKEGFGFSVIAGGKQVEEELSCIR
ncbi:type III-B CRISPR module-associated protein Cmr3 [Bacillus methanolicus]|uniref:type III-B CRISPR module-associated Cmr3 family protein n=1 Tax=Bacillus methanolicus TaxID=1471 RepID=UPI002380C044|nr:type III-B CRISPR module-associated Cmr3 family protein [Bacillus methanolicus]MDE3840933.1 type III-B CRISPR module-associated protein Cmr3 [Bacillus methanolicus]